MTANPGDAPTTAAPPTRRGRRPADTLSNRLLLARKLAGLTIDQAAEAAGVKPSSWANWEAGRRPQRETDVIGAIADALDIDEHWLMFGGPLAPTSGRPTKRSEPNTDWYPEFRPGATAGYGPYPASSNRPSDLRPNGRHDRTRPMSPAVGGRRAALVR